MQQSSKKRNRIFWLLQLLGWGSYNLVSIFLVNELSFKFLLYEITTGVFTGIFVTSLLRYYLKGNVSFESFGSKEIGKTVISTCTAILLYTTLTYGFGYFYEEFASFKTEVELQILEHYNSFWLVLINSVFMIFGWVVCYLAIKLLLKLNADRIDRLELTSTLRQAQLNTLKGQINPHFMFNSLNNIRGLMLEDVQKSREMLTKLSELLRYSLTKNDIDTIAVQEELEMVDNYIDLSKIQLEDRLEFVKNVAPESLAIPIPPMIIQLLVENAVKHGISNLKEGGTINLTVLISENALSIQLKNTGSLLISKESTSLGLKNIEQRLRLLYGDKANFSLEEVGEEVVANINIPLE